MVTMLFMAVTSAGSAELVAVSSLFTYDLYKTYINKNANGARYSRSSSLCCSNSRELVSCQPDTVHLNQVSGK